MSLVRALPLTSLAILSVAGFVVLLALNVPIEPGTAGSALADGLRFVAFGVWWVATWMERSAPALPGWLDGSLVIVLGFLPYLAADLLLVGRLTRKKG